MNVDKRFDELEKVFKDYCEKHNLDYENFNDGLRCLQDNGIMVITENTNPNAKPMIGGKPLKPIFRISNDTVVDLRKEFKEKQEKPWSSEKKQK